MFRFGLYIDLLYLKQLFIVPVQKMIPNTITTKQNLLLDVTKEGLIDKLEERANFRVFGGDVWRFRVEG